jgi:hypothetical protein
MSPCQLPSEDPKKNITAVLYITTVQTSESNCENWTWSGDDTRRTVQTEMTFTSTLDRYKFVDYKYNSYIRTGLTIHHFNITRKRWLVKITENRGAHIFQKFRHQLRILGARKGDMTQVPYWVPTNIRRRSTKFSGHGILAPGICTPLFMKAVDCRA